MGYITAPYSVFSSDTRQTPKTVEMVLDFAGWTVGEAAKEVRTDPLALKNGTMPKKVWQELLDKAGRRVFDDGCDL